MIYYCPFCWWESTRPFDRCPHCGRDLRCLKEMDYVERLILALSHPEPETRYRAAYLLGRLQAVQAIPALRQTARTSEDVFLIREIIRALGEIRDPQIPPILREFLKHPSFIVRKEAVQALGTIGGKAIREWIAESLSDPVESVRAAAYAVWKIVESAGEK